MANAIRTRKARPARRLSSRSGPRLGDKVIEVEGPQAKHMGDKLLIENLSFSLPPGGIVGVIGPNGAGKIDALQDADRAGDSPMRARSAMATRCKLSYVDQSRDDAERQ